MDDKIFYTQEEYDLMFNQGYQDGLSDIQEGYSADDKTINPDTSVIRYRRHLPKLKPEKSVHKSNKKEVESRYSNERLSLSKKPDNRI